MDKILLLFLLITTFGELSAQNLSVRFDSNAGAPNNLQVCGSSQLVYVKISNNSSQILENVEAKMNLISGVVFKGMNINESSQGINLIQDNQDAPVFFIPRIENQDITIAYWLGLDCRIQDTLKANGNLLVLDTWEFSNDNLSETVKNTEYRNAIKSPFLNLQPEKVVRSAAQGVEKTRSFKVTNSALSGTLDSFVYSSSYGAGLYLKELRVNGQPADFRKFTVESDTLIEAVITGAQMEKNGLGETIGNGDEVLDPDESVLIEEIIKVIDCQSSRASEHAVLWGCGNRLCQEVRTSAVIQAPVGLPKASITLVAPEKIVVPGYCNETQTGFVLSNSGTEQNLGAGTLRDLKIGVGFDEQGQLDSNSHKILTVNIAGYEIIPENNTLISLEIPSFQSDPDGNGGLTDEDGDGYYDDLPIGETLEVLVSASTSCNTSQGNDNCNQDKSVQYAAVVQFDNACIKDLQFSSSSYFDVRNKLVSVESRHPSDVFAESDLFDYTIRLQRSVFNFNQNCPDKKFLIKIAKPVGIIPDTASFVLRKPSTQDTFPVNIIRDEPDSIWVEINIANSNTFSGVFELDFSASAGCQANSGVMKLPVEINLVCGDCACTHIWYCGALDGPFVHKEAPPCQENQIEPCDNLIRTTNFAVDRKTFGYSDEAMTLPVDTAAINTKAALPHDSVQMILTGIVGPDLNTNRAFGQITYSQTDVFSGNPIFVFTHGRLEHFRNGNRTSIPISQNAFSENLQENKRQVQIALEEGLNNANVTLETGDSLSLRIMSTVNPEGAFILKFTEIPDFRGTLVVEQNGTLESCQSFGESFQVGKIRHFYSTPNTPDMASGCQTTTLSYLLLVEQNGFSDAFPNEYRQNLAIDSFRLELNPAILNDYQSVQVSIKVENHKIHGDNFFDIPLDELQDGTFSLSLVDAIEKVALNRIITDGLGALNLKLVPNCKTNADVSHSFNPIWYFKDKMYTEPFEPSLITQIKTQNNNKISYQNPPVLNLQPETRPYLETTKNEVVWEFSYCNISNASDVGTFAIQLKDIGRNLTIKKLEDITNSANPTPVSYHNLSDGLYFIGNNLLKNNGFNPYEDHCRKFRITATLNDCEPNLLKVLASWRCEVMGAGTKLSAFDQCQFQELNLRAAVPEAFLNASIIEQPGQLEAICQENEVTILIKNISPAELVDVSVDIWIPGNGIDLNTSGFQYAYPANTPMKALQKEPEMVEITEAGRRYRISNIQYFGNEVTGLKAFDSENPSADNQLRIKFPFTTDCNILDGSQIRYAVQGVQFCGKPTNISAGETFPIRISSDNPIQEESYIIETPGIINIGNGQTRTVTLSVKSLSNAPTTGNNNLIVRIPKRFEVVEGSFVSGGDMQWDVTTPETEIKDSIQIVRWRLPANQTLDETIVLNFDLINSIDDCSNGKYGLALYTTNEKEVSCSSSGNTCGVKAISSQGGINTVSINLYAASIALDIKDYTLTCISSGNNFQLTGKIQNISDNDLSAFSMVYFSDKNQNQRFDDEDLLFSRQTISQMGSGESRNLSHTFNLLEANSCSEISIFMDYPTSENNCNNPYINLGIIPLRNAGEDMFFCVPGNRQVDTTIGSLCPKDLYTYQWEAIGPATINMLSASDVPNPDIRFISKTSDRDTLRFILETNRSFCSTKDTINLIRGEQIELDEIVDKTINIGEEIEIQAVLKNGNNDIVTFQWSPNLGLLRQTGRRNKLSPPQTTTYSVSAHGTSGCSDSENFTIFVDASCQLPQFNFTEVIHANDASGSIELHTIDQVSDNLLIQWSPNEGNNIRPFFRTGLAPGIYTIDIQNPVIEGCKSTKQVAVNEVDVSIARVKEIRHETCGQQNGLASLVPTTFNFEWSDGKSGHIRTDLKAGSYAITATNNSGEKYYLTLEIAAETRFDMQHTIIQYPDDSNTGSVKLEINNPERFSFKWSNGEIGQQSSQLSSGMHLVTVTNIKTGCQDIYPFVLPPNNEVKIQNLKTKNPLCYQASNGSVSYEVDIPEELELVARTSIVTINNVPVVADQLPEGSFCVVVRDNNDNLLGGECFVLEAPAPIHLRSELYQDCELATNTIELITQGGSKPYEYFWADIGVQSSAIRENVASGIYQVSVIDSNNCQYRQPELRVPNCETNTCDVQLNGLPTNIVRSDCNVDEKLSVCLDEFDVFFYKKYDLHVNGIPVNGTDNCKTKPYYSLNFMSLDFSSGPYQLDNFEVNGIEKSATFSSLDMLLDSIFYWTNTEWIYDNVNKTLYAAEDPGIKGMLFFDSFNIPLAINTTQENLSVGNTIEIDTSGIELAVFDRINGCWDTLPISLTCKDNLSDDVTQSILLNEIVEVCLSSEDFGFEETISSIREICPDKNSRSVDFKFFDNCFEYGGSRLGRDTACIEVCAGNQCDTIQYDIEVKTKPFIFVDSLYLDQQKRFCFATDIFPDSIQKAELLCPGNYGEYVEYNLTPNHCVEYMGVKGGQDTICLALCDVKNHCDTVNLFIKVLDISQKPELQDDIDSTFENQPLIIDVRANDPMIASTGPTELTQQVENTNGEAIVNTDGSITYTPKVDVCGNEDIFSYFICNQYGCDTAEVRIYVKCFNGVTVFKAFSPNGDGNNDYLYIAGLENFPNHQLFVYNQWGNLVYETENYNNSWEGTWQGNRTLPDGTYYYILYLNDSSQQILKGFVEMYR